MVPAGHDVLDPQGHEVRQPVAARPQPHAQLSPIRGEGERRGGPSGVDPPDRMMVGTEGVEDVIADDELANRGLARELDGQGDAVHAGRGRSDRPRTRATSRAVRVEANLVADDAEYAVARAGVTLAHAPQLLALRGRQRSRPEGEAIVDGRALHGDAGMAGAAAGMRPEGRGGDQQGGEQPRDAERAAHGRAVLSTDATSFSRLST